MSDNAPTGSTRSNIRDVAARAGVAVKTVSRVLNGHPYVSAEMRERVELAMRALDFRPSVAARILSGAKSNQVALIYDNHSPHYIHQIQTGVWARCIEEGVRLLAQPRRSSPLHRAVRPPARLWQTLHRACCPMRAAAWAVRVAARPAPCPPSWAMPTATSAGPSSGSPMPSTACRHVGGLHRPRRWRGCRR